MRKGKVSQGKKTISCSTKPNWHFKKLNWHFSEQFSLTIKWSIRQNLKKLVVTGNPAAEGSSYFFINKISNFQTYSILMVKKCVKLAIK